MNKKLNRLLVGVFCFGACAILLGFAFFTGTLSFLREDNERFVLVFNENLYGLHEGSKVTLNGVRIGRVERFFLGEAVERGPVPVQIEVNRKLVMRHMVETKNEIFDTGGSFRKAIIPKLVGQLSQESFVTGILYINLTTNGVGSAETTLADLHGYPVIRTKGSIFAEISESINLEKLSKQVHDLMAVTVKRLEELDFVKLSSEIFETGASLRKALEHFSTVYMPLGTSLTKSSNQAQSALVEIEKLALDLGSLFKPNSEFRYELDDTLRDVSSMAKSLKSLADLLERNPQAFIIGKPNVEE